MDARIIITYDGWFSSLPLATKDFVARKLKNGIDKQGWVKLVADQRGAPKLPEFKEL